MEITNTFITLCILPFTDKTKGIALSSLDSNVSVSNSMVTINPLPKNHFYNTLDNNAQPKSDQRQVFKYVENTGTIVSTLSLKTVVSSNCQMKTKNT